MTRKMPPRRHTDFSHITVCDTVRMRLAAAYARLHTWAAVGAELDVAGGTCQRVATTDYEPRNPVIRARLGFPPVVPVVACACGEVHLRKGRCPNAPRPAELSRYTAAISWLAGRKCGMSKGGKVILEKLP